MQRNTNSKNRLKYANGDFVPLDATIRSDETGRATKHYVIHPDGSKTQVYTANALSMNRLKYANGDFVPLGTIAYSDGKGNTKNYFVIQPDGAEIPVYKANALRRNRLKYANGDCVPEDAVTCSEGKGNRIKHFVIHPNGTKTQVFTVGSLNMKRTREKEFDTPETKRRRTSDNDSAYPESHNTIPSQQNLSDDEISNIYSEGQTNERINRLKLSAQTAHKQYKQQQIKRAFHLPAQGITSESLDIPIPSTNDNGSLIDQVRSVDNSNPPVLAGAPQSITSEYLLFGSTSVNTNQQPRSVAYNNNSFCLFDPVQNQTSQEEKNNNEEGNIYDDFYKNDLGMN